MISAIKEVVALAEHTPLASLAEIEQVSKRFALVSTRVERNSVLLDNLFGIELASKDKIKADLAALKHEQSQLHKRITLGSRYHQLSMEPLTWRDKKGWPRLVVFSLDSPSFTIGIRKYERFRTSEWGEWIIPELPRIIASYYKDVFKTLRENLKNKYKSTPDREFRSLDIIFELSCLFEGVIPDDVKRKIIEARGSFENVFLIAEPNGFKVNETSVTKRDPLIVGFDGSQLWLIADFETTPVEEAMIFSLPDTKGEGGVR